MSIFIRWSLMADDNLVVISSDDNYHHHRFATTTKIKNRCPGFWRNVFEIFFGGREEIWFEFKKLFLETSNHRMISNIHFLLTSALFPLWSLRSAVHRDFCSLFHRKIIWDRIGRRRRPPAFGRARDTICLSICALFPIENVVKSLETFPPWILQRRIHQCP